MLLAIDIGNTNTVFAVFKGAEIVESWRIQTDAMRSEDEYAVLFNQLFMMSDLVGKAFAPVIISSVVPEANRTIAKFCEKFIGALPVFVTKDMVDIAALIDRPDDIGADRLVNAAAVKAHYKTPAVVVDFGTATTFDVVDADGNYAGGVIAPGINLSMAALHQAASKLPKISVKRPDHAIGKDTVSAMRAGVYWGYLGLVDRILSEIKAEIGDDVYVIATGGLAPLFAKDNDAIDNVDGDLTLKGLYLIAQKQGF